MSRYHTPSVPGKRQRYRANQPGIQRRKQRGATAIEFALVFPLFFAVFYAIVSYSLIFVAEQSLTLATAEGARAALNYQKAGTVSDAITLRAAAACNTATNMVAQMIRSSDCQTTVQTPCTYDATMTCIAVTLTYHYSVSPLVPNLPVLGLVMPKNLVGQATVQLNPINIL